MTHWDGCWDAGPRHYECALARIKIVESERDSALDDAVSYMQRLEYMQAELAKALAKEKDNEQ